MNNVIHFRRVTYHFCSVATLVLKKEPFYSFPLNGLWFTLSNSDNKTGGYSTSPRSTAKPSPSLTHTVAKLAALLPSPGVALGEGWSHLLTHLAVGTTCLAAQSCLTLCNPVDFSPPGSSVHGILQARILECVAISFSTKKKKWIFIFSTFFPSIVYSSLSSHKVSFPASLVNTKILG